MSTPISPWVAKSTRRRGLVKIDTSDDVHFNKYLDQLLQPQNLFDFGRSCYEEESQVDPGEFQAKMLDLLCQLYVQTADDSLKMVLRDILRMLITYIMGHTLTIVEETLPTVISHVRYQARIGRSKYKRFWQGSTRRGAP